MMKKRKNREIDESLPIRMANNIFPPPIFTTDCSSAQECLEYYKRFQILHYRLSNHQQSSYPLMSTPLKGLQAVWNVKKEIITTQWKIENYCGVYEDSLTAERIIMGSGISERSHPFYASCVIDCQTENEDSHEADENANCRDNNDTNSFAIADTFLDGYIRHPPFAKWDDFRHDDTIWVFLGKNVSSTSDHSSMQGRTEHTDFVDHTGAWHFQISGSKIWRCRPVEDSPEWGDQGAPAISECCDDKSSSISGGGSSSRSSSSISGGSSGSSSSSSISGSGSSISGGSSSGSSSSSGGSNDAGAGNESSGDSSSHNNRYVVLLIY